MVVLLREDAAPEQRAEVAHLLAELGAHDPISLPQESGAWLLYLPGLTYTDAIIARITALPQVARLIPITTPYALASRAVHPDATRVRVGSVVIGGGEPVIIAGPCSVEGEDQMREAALAARDAGAHLLRGGAFKPRTSPYAFQGLGLRGLELLAQAGAAAGLPVVTEVMEPSLVADVAEFADVLQIGSRNMQNFPLLRAAGRSGRPVLLKRGFAATIDEWLLAAEYLLAEGNPHIILCERGIRGFDPQTRNLLDLAAVPLLRTLTHLPVLVDPSHGTGRRELILPMSAAAIAAGADGLLIEMSPHPDAALSDADQTIDPSTLRAIAQLTRRLRAAITDLPPDPLPGRDGEKRECGTSSAPLPEAMPSLPEELIGSGY
ncbi:MAG: 2-keto-3-deoxy-D-arabino-heptulosonate-7-phosphate synthase I beta [Ktedonobacterales bacterium]|nr:MAG: 2-keto-3-deoxy-D-arabino-heptulosonate-7-phosphate synthase I beta [Ktedonobacterales bacterium]